jgi:hypothetical protein
MSWKALDWAKGVEVGSSTMRLVLILLANKADENFSCYPSVRTLTKESCAARSTVLETLRRLEAEGHIVRVAQYHESGAQRSSRYLLNHPDAPHLHASPKSVPGCPGAGPGASPAETGSVRHSAPTGVRIQDPLNRSDESPIQPAPSSLLRSLPEPWKVSLSEAAQLAPAVERALDSGWTAQALATHLSRNPNGVRYPSAVLARRLAELPDPRRNLLRQGASWCGDCEDPQSRTITTILPNRSEAARFCPRCSPQARAQATRPDISTIDPQGR